MSKFSNMLKAIKTIEERNMINSKELSEVLGVSERMVRKYAADIKEAGLPLMSKAGPEGGYYFPSGSRFIPEKTETDEKITKATFNKSGKGYKNIRIFIPNSWAEIIGVSKDDREMLMTFDEEEKKITITKLQVMEHEENKDICQRGKDDDLL